MTVRTRWLALGTTVEVVVTEPAAVFAARRAVAAELDALDRACSRFRADSELVALNAAAGRPFLAGPLLAEAIDVALTAAARTGGAVDPTVGAGMVAAGYDRDHAALPLDAPADAPRPAVGWETIRLDRASGLVGLPADAQLDLGATAKGLGADRAAAAAARATGGGVLVSLGGDIAVAGPAPGPGWSVALADDHRDRGPAPAVHVRDGGLATSSTTVRRWRRGGREVHHILDPSTGEPAGAPWRTVSVAAGTCAEANAFSTAAIVWGPAAVACLETAGVHARLLAADGRVATTGGWPAERDAA